MSMWVDFKYALRLLFKAPKFTAMTVGVLVGGLSISLFTFSFLYTTVYKPLPLPEGESAKAITIFEDGNFSRINGYEYWQIKDNLTKVAEFGIYDNLDVRVSIEQSGKSYSASYVRNGFFEFSRTKPIIGRTISQSDTESGAPHVAVISYAVWQSDLNGDENVTERTLMINGQKTQIIGVMPKGYRFPNTSRIWLPMFENTILKTPGSSGYYNGYARAKAGYSISEAEQEIGQAVNQIYQQNVKLYDLPEVQKNAKLMSFQMMQTGGEGGIAFAFLNAVSWLILLLACINVGNLLLARSIERQKETAIRAALGATTARLVSQLMWEGIIISVLGGVLAILLAGAVLDYTNVALKSWIPGGGSFWWNYGMDLETFLMGVAFTVVTIFLAAFLPAWRSANQNINTTLRDGTRGAQSKKAGKVSRFLVTTQVFIVATLMLIGSISGFIAHKFINLELGDNYHGVMSARFVIPENKYPEDKEKLVVVDRLINQIKANPQVVDVLSNNWIARSVLTMNGIDYASERDKPLVDTINVIGNTETVGVNLLAGRHLNHQDKLGARKVVLISQSMANRYWPGESPLDKDFSITMDDKTDQVFVVGVVTDRMNPNSMFGKLDSEDEIYVSGRQYVSAYQIFQYRINPNTVNAEEIFYRAMFNVDRNIELVYAVQPAIKNRNKMRESMQLLSKVTFGTGFFALMLALVGIYGLTANTVAQRTHEVGIRRAVGASDKSIIHMFLKQSARQLMVGLGLALALFGVISYGFHQFTEELFPVYMYFTQAIVVAVGLSLVVMVAVYAPTKRAVKMEPSTALRYE